MITQALTLTLRLAVVVSAILLALGLPLAYWMAFSRRRWKFFVEAAVSLPSCFRQLCLASTFLSPSVR